MAGAAIDRGIVAQFSYSDVMPQSHPLQVRLSDTTLDHLDRLAEMYGFNRSETARRLIERGLSRFADQMMRRICVLDDNEILALAATPMRDRLALLGQLDGISDEGL